MSGRVFEAFYQVVRAIPSGKVATYGQIARLAGMPRCARTVGYAMAGCQDPSIPCHRWWTASAARKPALTPVLPAPSGPCWRRKESSSAQMAPWTWSIVGGNHKNQETASTVS